MIVACRRETDVAERTMVLRGDLPMVVRMGDMAMGLDGDAIGWGSRKAIADWLLSSVGESAFAVISPFIFCYLCRHWNCLYYRHFFAEHYCFYPQKGDADTWGEMGGGQRRSS